MEVNRKVAPYVSDPVRGDVDDVRHSSLAHCSAFVFLLFFALGNELTGLAAVVLQHALLSAIESN